jgi:hypothetical protein
VGIKEKYLIIWFYYVVWYNVMRRELSPYRGGALPCLHAAVRDEDFAMLPQCGEGVRRAQHDHMIIGRNEIGVQHMIKAFAEQLGVALN